MVSRLARTKLPAMEVLPVTEPRLEVKMVRTMDSHQAMGVRQAMETLLVTGILLAMELLLAARVVLARDHLPVAEVVRATSILRAVEVMAVLQGTDRATVGLLVTVRQTMEALRATELIIIIPRPHLIHLHQATRNPISQRPLHDRLVLSSCRRKPRTQMAPTLHPRWAILPQGQGLHFPSQVLGRRIHTTPILHLARVARLAQEVTIHQAVPCHPVA